MATNFSFSFLVKKMAVIFGGSQLPSDLDGKAADVTQDIWIVPDIVTSTEYFEDINLTDKVLFRLEEKLLELQESEPRVPISAELEEYYETTPTVE